MSKNNKSADITIGFDVTWLKSNEWCGGGISHYSQRLISALVKYSDLNIVAIVTKEEQGVFNDIKNKKNFKTVALTHSNNFPDVIMAEKIDIVHTPTQFFHHITFNVPMITTLHDLQHFHYPDFFSSEEINFRDKYYRASAHLSERIIVTFNHVKGDICNFYGIEADKIDICPVGLESEKVDKTLNHQTIIKKYNLPDKYLFYSASTWRHKNHMGLIKALKILHDEYDNKIHLVCTGKKLPDFFPEIELLINKLCLNDFVHFLGYIPEHDKNVILKMATVAVIPSLYEAGSYPLIEAMAYNVPVVCSNVTSLPDTIDNNNFVFDPNNIQQIAKKISSLLNDPYLIDENINNSIRRTKEFKWENNVKNFVNSYEKSIETFNQNIARSPLYSRLLSFEDLWHLLIKEKENEISLIKNSRSWRLTIPIRAISKLFKSMILYFAK